MAEAVLLEAVQINVIGVKLGSGLHSGPQRVILNVICLDLLKGGIGLSLFVSGDSYLKLRESCLFHRVAPINNATVN